MSLNKFTDGSVRKEWMNINCKTISAEVATFDAIDQEMDGLLLDPNVAPFPPDDGKLLIYQEDGTDLLVKDANNVVTNLTNPQPSIPFEQGLYTSNISGDGSFNNVNEPKTPTYQKLGNKISIKGSFRANVVTNNGIISIDQVPGNLIVGGSDVLWGISDGTKGGGNANDCTLILTDIFLSGGRIEMLYTTVNNKPITAGFNTNTVFTYYVEYTTNP